MLDTLSMEIGETLEHLDRIHSDHIFLLDSTMFE
jgi:hypothetical protein